MHLGLCSGSGCGLKLAPVYVCIFMHVHLYEALALIQARDFHLLDHEQERALRKDNEQRSPLLYDRAHVASLLSMCEDMDMHNLLLQQPGQDMQDTGVVG